MNALALALWFVSYQAGTPDQNLRHLPYGGGAYTSKALCMKAGAAGVNDLTLHRPKDIVWSKGFKWTFKCALKPIKLRTLEELDKIHNGHDMADMPEM
jgi:hypothetical protein